MDNVFQNGVLVKISSSVWGGRVKFPKEFVNVENTIDEDNMTEEQKKKLRFDKNFLKSTKLLIDPEYLKSINSKKNKARNLIRAISFASPIEGIYFCSKNMVDRAIKILDEINKEFLDEVEKFCSQFDIFINEAESHLGAHFNILEYPKNIRKHFDFSYDFITISAPDESLNLFSPEFYKAEKLKFQQAMLEMRIGAMEELRNRFKKLISHVVERLSDNNDGERKKFKEATIDNFKSFCDDFDAMNIFEDAELKKLVETGKQLAGLSNVEVIKQNEEYRAKLCTMFNTMENEVDKMMEDKPIRSIIF